MRTITFFIFLCLILVFPISAKAQAPVPGEIPQAVTEEEVNRFFDEYTARYISMDFDAFMNLFSQEAVENRMRPYADIGEGYRRTFANSRSIVYSLEIYSILTYEKGASVRGRYELIQSFKGSKKKGFFEGDIQWELIRENGSLKIKEINYGRDR